MATYSVKITQAGQPVQGVAVTASTVISDITDAEGRVSASLGNTGPIAVQVVVTGAGFTFGGGPYLLLPDVDTTIEVA